MKKKPSEIQVGKTYCNRGKGTTKRTVMNIGDEWQPKAWHSMNPRPNEPGVCYLQNGQHYYLYLSMFARWCGKEVTEE